ncbi:GNAT family N-acetyltransferase [Viscerimonas tarda]
MINLLEDCELVALSSEQLIIDFNCDDEDLNDFFNHDAINYQNQLLGQTYFFRHLQTGKVVCAFSLSADSIKTFLLPNSRRKKVKDCIPYQKSLNSYPSFLIGRFGVALGFEGQGIGSQLIEFVKDYSLAAFPNISRFLVVDAYNVPAVLRFYQKNEFTFVFSTEEQEREYLKRSPEEAIILRTRLMFYDMIHWKNE